MNIEITGNREAAEEILALTARWDKAVGQLDSAALTRDYRDDVQVFDIGSQLTGRENLKALWEESFGYFGKEPKVYRAQAKIHATSEMAVFHFYSKICGSNQPEHAKSPWCRTTVCFQKIDGQWIVIHEHISMPINMETGTVALLKEPG